MKAIVYRKYGLPDVLNLEEVEKPTPGDDEVLVRVHAASVNSWDWEFLRGTPFANRVLGGLFRPRRKILGADIAGRIEAVGRKVARFQPGDEVFGDISGCGWGGFAEYVCARENALAPKPPGITFEQAAAVPQAGVIALQGLRKIGQVQPGHKVLINGAGGGVGTFAVQLARLSGAEVTGVDAAEKLDTMLSAGAESVVDFRQEDFTRSGRRYDLVIDCALQNSIFRCRRVLNPGGTYVVIGGSTARIMMFMLTGLLVSRFSGRKTGLLIHKPNVEDLAYIGELLDTGQMKPEIDRRYQLSEVPEALRYFGEGRVRGKIVVAV